jgi:hypothetical protein
MKEYMTKPKKVEVYTFDEFVQYGIDSGAPLHDGIPWSFDFYSSAVTHEDNDRYIVNGFDEFSRGGRIVVSEGGKAVPYDLVDFENKFDNASTDNSISITVNTGTGETSVIGYGQPVEPFEFAPTTVYWTCSECGKSHDCYFPKEGCDFCDGDKISEKMGLSKKD